MAFAYIAFVSAAISLIVVLLMTPWLIRYLKKIGLVVKDQNKEGTPLLPLSGGMAVLAGILAGITSFIFFRTFFPSMQGILILNNGALSNLFAGTLTILIITFVGFVDDLVIRSDHDSSTGLKQWQKPLITLAAAVPLMVVGAGDRVMAIPLIGEVNFGLIYPLILIPLGVVGAANMVNLLGGLNGLETGMGIIYMGSLGLYAYVNQSYIGALIALVTLAALIGFYFYNKFPAKILPGDSLTYLLGASIACIAILGNIERAAIIVAIPFFIEFVLKARSKFKAQSYGYYENGKVKSKYEKIYSLTHLFMKGKYTEKQVTYFVIAIELIFSALIWVI
jgi:UDP-N-acetylglucosamine--dolichyl-phosphate N-acetylglucosaminephosphotransferase